MLSPKKILKRFVGRSKLKTARQISEIKLCLGSGGIYDKGWIPSEFDTLNILKKDDWDRYFNLNSITALLSEHVWEHLTEEDGELAAQNCYKYLKPGGYLRVAVPDGYHGDPKYIEAVKPGGTGWGSDDHKVLYTYNTFSKIFEKSGFKVELLEYFDEKHKFHFKPWDPLMGKIRRSRRFDERNQDGTLSYTSLILDCHKA